MPFMSRYRWQNRQNWASNFWWKMRKTAQVVSNTKSTVRWNNVVNLDDAVANDIKYHLPCWVELQRRDLTSNNDTVGRKIIQETENCSQIATDLELITNIAYERTCSSKIGLNTSTVDQLYIKLLLNDRMKNVTQSKQKYKKIN